MADINWDSALPNPSLMTMGLAFNTLRMPPNPLTGATRTVGMPGARWTASMTWELLNRAPADGLRALLLTLRGQANRLVIWDLVQPTFRGIGSGTPLVFGTNQTGTTLNIDGCANNVSGWALPGDKFSVNSELKIVTAVANSNGSGQATISFEPALRASPADNAPLIISAPTTKFMLESNAVLWEYLTGSGVRNIRINLIEAFV